MFKKLILVPEKLNLEQFLMENPADFDFNFDYGYALLHQILIETSYKISKVKDWKNFKTFKPIRDYFLPRKAEILQLKFKNYNKHLEYFYRNNILWRTLYDERNCRKYQLDRKYFAEKVRFVEITDRKVISILFKDKGDTNDYHPLNKWFDKRLQIDTKSALENLNSSFEVDMNWNQYLLRCSSVIGIANNHYHFSRKTDICNRFYTNITSSPRVIRKFLRFDGKRLGEADISASVPFFLYCHLLYLVGNKNIKTSFFESFFKTKRYYSNALNKTKSMVNLDEKEVLRFGETLLDGTFYQEIMTHFDDNYYKKNSEHVLERAFNDSEDDKKIIAKKMILSSLNSKNSHHRETKEIMEKIYPTIMKFLTVFKRRWYLNKAEKIKLEKKLSMTEHTLKEKFQQHKKVPHLLLQTESYFMLDIMVRRLNKRHSKMPFFTLHDCIVTTEENIDFLYDVMKEMFIETFGFSADLKPKVFA